jgi:hypothetical protein
MKASAKQRTATKRAAEWKRFAASAVSVSDTMEETEETQESVIEGAMELWDGNTEELSDTKVKGLILWREKAYNGRLSEVWYLHRPIGRGIIGSQLRLGSAQVLSPNDARARARNLRRG